MRSRILPYGFAIALMFFAGPASAARIIVMINGFHSATGNVFVGLYANPSKFLNGNQVDAFKKVPASTGPIRVVFDNLPPGTYAVGAYHDENANDRLDTNVLGLPVEGYALSNGVRAILARPRFTDAAFTVGGGDKPIACRSGTDPGATRVRWFPTAQQAADPERRSNRAVGSPARHGYDEQRDPPAQRSSDHHPAQVADFTP